jgi:hypothetical protein
MREVVTERLVLRLLQPEDVAAFDGERLLVRVSDEQPRTAEVGVTLAPAKQGSGLATEALGAMVARLRTYAVLRRKWGA